MIDIAQDSGAIEAREAAHLEVEELLVRARAAVARSREILDSSRRPVPSALDAPPSADSHADGG